MIHADQAWDWLTHEEAEAAGESWPHRTTRIFCNFGVDAMLPENGSTQVWPTTHARKECLALPVRYHEAEPGSERGTWSGGVMENDIAITALVDRQREGCPPVQLTVPKGAVAIRDNRCWHAAQPNNTSLPR
jgi:ectoine hydroxylase-related dioxygenase (phytanoyl-CoA dioxygenase family)